MSDLDMSDVCDELANIIISEDFMLVHPGWAIQRFCALIEDKETPVMALSIIKRELEGNINLSYI